MAINTKGARRRDDDMTSDSENSKPFADGYGIIYQSLMRNKDLNIEAKALFAYLSSFAGKTNRAFPNVDLICHELNISPTRFKKYRKQLEEHGYLKVERYRRENGFSNNVYILCHDGVSGSFVSVQNDTITKGCNDAVSSDNCANENPVSYQFVSVGNDPPKNNSIKNNNIKDISAINSTLETEFNNWWNLYDKKRDKKIAMTKFKTARKKHSFDDIMKGTRDYLKTIKDKQYQKYPKTFLQQETYLEDFTADTHNADSNAFNIDDYM